MIIDYRFPEQKTDAGSWRDLLRKTPWKEGFYFIESKT
jgi:hypothetical protein